MIPNSIIQNIFLFYHIPRGERKDMIEKSELLAQQVRSSRVQVDSRPTIELVTPGVGKGGELSWRIICPPNCLPNCPPVCPPNIRPTPCDPWRLPRPPRPPGSNLR